jgi:prevent-host-death family protein
LRRVDVAVSALRADLARWLDRVRNGEEVVITERGTPVARLVAVESAPLLEELTRRGVLAAPVDPSRPSARSAERVRAHGSVSDLVAAQRG